LLAEQIARTQGPTIVVENRPGAGTVIGTDAASRAQPDGSTVLITTPEFVIAPHLRKLSYDPLTSFEPICYLVRSPQLIVVNAASPYHTLADLTDAARARPDELTLASAGPASSPQMAFAMLEKAAGIRMTYVPYPGSAPAVSALLGGHVTAVMAAYPNVAEQVKAGQLRALATASRTRIDSLAEVPTLAESGYQDFEADLWYGMVAPAGTPACSPRRCWRRRSSRSSPSRGSLRSGPAAPILPRTCASNTTAMAASFARPISRRSELRRVS
jgi:tripartite-type tricarboxylate transporter receptor subunit TctC